MEPEVGGRSGAGTDWDHDTVDARDGDVVGTQARSRRFDTELVFWHLLPLVPFVLLHTWLDRRTVLPEASYRQPVVGWEWLVGLPVLEAGVLVLAVGALAHFREPFGTWDSWTSGRVLRILVGVATTALAWWFVTADVNLFMGRVHLVDRLLVLVLALAVWWRPVFVLPFLVVVLTLDGQYHHPLGRHSVAQISLPSNLLLLFVAAHLVQVVTRRSMARHFVFLTFCMIATSYVVPGLGKLRLGWVGHRDVHLMIFSSHSVGWLGTAGTSTIERIGHLMELTEWPIVVATIVVECGAVILLAGRRIAMLWLVLFVGLNTMILLTTGIFFWTWITINATLLVLVWRGRSEPGFDVFSGTALLISLPVIGLGGAIFDPVELAWLDAPINYTYHLEATTESGRRAMVATEAFAPYDTQFALGDFGHLSTEPHLGIVWGAVHDRDLARELAGAGTIDEIWDIERRRGRVAFDPRGAEAFDRFVREVVGRWNTGADRSVPVLGWLAAPRQVWLSSHAAAGPLDEPIVSVSVHQVVTYYDGERYDVVRDQIVRVIPVEPSR